MGGNWLQVLRDEWSPLDKREGLLFWKRCCSQNLSEMAFLPGLDPVFLVSGMKVWAPFL